MNPGRLQQAIRDGDAALRARRTDEAARHFREARDIDARSPDIAARLAAALGMAGKHDEASAIIDAALSEFPDHAALHFQRGNVLAAIDNDGAAIEAYRRATALRPEWVQAQIVYATLLNKRREFRMALDILASARAAGEDSAACWAQIGFALIGLERLEGAGAALIAALARDPNQDAAWRALGHVMRLRGRFASARDAYRRAHDRGDPAALRGLIEAQLDLGDLDAATPLIAQIRARADDSTARWLAARRAFLAGDLAAAWPDYESRLDGLTDRATHPAPEWRGEDLAGKHLMVLGEQGHGDILQFVRFAPVLRQRAARLTLGIEAGTATLAPLLRSVAGIDAVEVFPELSPADFQITLLSVPAVLKTDMDDIPAAPYVRAPIDRAAPPDLARAPGLKIGLIWAGDPAHGNDRHRSMPFTAMLPLASVPRVRLFALQKGARAADVSGHEALVTPLSDRIGDWRDTAAILAALDLLIAVDTGPVHLAGAMGRPVWVALPFAPDWRWMLKREDSPWYPGLRLFRQTSPGDWEGVIARMRAAMARLTAGGRPGDAGTR